MARKRMVLSVNLDNIFWDYIDRVKNPAQARQESGIPHMWTVFFKIDGSSVVLSDTWWLEGSATVVDTPGHHGDLGWGSV